MKIDRPGAELGLLGGDEPMATTNRRLLLITGATGKTGVRSIVSMSQISARREASSNAARQHWLAERMLDRSPMLTAHLKPTFFTEWVILGWLATPGH